MAIPCPPEVNLELDIKRWQDLGTSKYHVSLEATTGSNIDKHVFVFKQQLDRDPATGLFNCVFEAIASTQALAEFKVDEPNPGQVFFRKSFVELEFDSIIDAQNTEALIRSDLNELIDATEETLATWQSETVIEI